MTFFENKYLNLTIQLVGIKCSFQWMCNGA